MKVGAARSYFNPAKLACRNIRPDAVNSATKNKNDLVDQPSFLHRFLLNGEKYCERYFPVKMLFDLRKLVCAKQSFKSQRVTKGTHRNLSATNGDCFLHGCVSGDEFHSGIFSMLQNWIYVDCIVTLHRISPSLQYDCWIISGVEPLLESPSPLVITLLYQV